MSNLNSITLLLLSFIMTSCATTPSQDSDFTVYGEEMEGPGLFSGDSGEIVFFEDKQETAATTGNDIGDAEVTQGLSNKDWQEFSAFKRWLNSKQTQDETYQEFQQWLRYEQYLQWQETQ